MILHQCAKPCIVEQSTPMDRGDPPLGGFHRLDPAQVRGCFLRAYSEDRGRLLRSLSAKLKLTLGRREFAVAVSLSTVGRYLKAWGLSAQRPVRRAYERDDAAIAAWLKQVYPAIAREAKAESSLRLRLRLERGRI